jgi:hypothetical protein
LQSIVYETITNSKHLISVDTILELSEPTRIRFKTIPTSSESTNF